MRILKKKSSEVRPRFGSMKTMLSFFYHNPEHTPFSKRPGEVSSSQVHMEVCMIPVKRDTEGTVQEAWIELKLEETTVANQGGRAQTRTITATLEHEHRAKLLAYLLERASLEELSQAGVVMQRHDGPWNSVVRNV